MNQKWIIIAEYLNEAQVSAYQSLLAEHGLKSRIERSITSTTLSIMGVGLTGTKLLVILSDSKKVAELINAQSLDMKTKKSKGHRSWICPNCKEEVDGGFQICWNCQTEFDSSMDQPDSFYRKSEEETHKEQEIHCSSCGEILRKNEDICNKCGTCRSDLNKQLVQSSDSSIREADLLLRSAWRKAVMGTLVLPCILNLRSLYLLSKFHKLDVPIYLKSNWKKSAALYVNLILLAYWGLVFFYVAKGESLVFYFVVFLQTFFYWDPFHTWEISVNHQINEF